jgi:hypothetical protein
LQLIAPSPRIQITNNPGAIMFSNLLAAPVTTALNTVASFNCNQARTLGIEVKNTGANALNAFEVWGRISPTGNPIKLSSAAADFTGPAYPVLKASGSPLALANGATAWVFFDVSGLAEVQVKASVGAATTTLELHSCAKFST